VAWSIGVLVIRKKAPTLADSICRALYCVLTYLAIGSCAASAQNNQPGRETFAEMIAFAKLAPVACERLAPNVENFHALALTRLIKPPLTEKEIATKEKELKRRRGRLGLRGWCQLYAGEMEQARILVQVLRRRN
jgi:hypothetical protein